MRDLEPKKKSLPPLGRSGQATWHVKPRSSLGTVLLNDAIALASGPAQSLAVDNSNGAVMVNSTGVRYFFTDQTAVIRQASGGAATNTSSPI